MTPSEFAAKWQGSIVTPRTSKHRIFAWIRRPTLPDCQLIVIAREDDYAFGILQSKAHEAWSLATIRRQGVGNDPVYASSFAFETFPFPWPLDLSEASLSPAQIAHRDTVTAAAAELDALRSRWLSPPELVVTRPPVAPGLPEEVIPKDDESAAALKNRTLTKLYNTRPAWLDLAHKKLDAAVTSAYGWSAEMSDEDLVGALLGLNAERQA